MAPNDTPDWTSVTQVETVPGSVVSTSVVVDYLGAAAIPAGNGIVTTIAAPHSYGWLMMVAGPETAPATPVAVAVRPQPGGTTPLSVYAPAYAAPFTPPVGKLTFATARVPLNSPAGRTLTIRTYGAVRAGSLLVWGVTGPPPFPVRADGRVYPQGVHQIGAQYAPTTGAVIATPTPLCSILVGEIAVVGGITTTAGNVHVRGMVGGTVRTLLWVPWPAGRLSPPVSRRAPAAGILLDPTQNLTVMVAGAGALAFPTVSVAYDVVP